MRRRLLSLLPVRPLPPLLSAVAADASADDAAASALAAAAAAASVDLPVIAPGDAGKVLTVNGTEDGYELETPSAGLADGDYGDFTVSSGGTVATIDDNVVTNAKLADMATSTIKGRATASTGDPEDLTAAQARTILNVANGATANVAATASDQETATSTTSHVTPGVQHRHPSACKAHACFNPAGTLLASFNVASITDHGVGTWSVNMTTAFSSANWSAHTDGGHEAGVSYTYTSVSGQSASLLQFSMLRAGTATFTDPTSPAALYFSGFGDQ